MRSGATGARPLTLVVGLCGALPVIVATVHALQEHWQPVADRGIIALRSYDVFSTHMPLVGQYSFASAITGKPTYSLGPMLYWLLAPAAHVGAPDSLVLTMGAVNVACILGAVELARRRGGVWLALALAAGVAVMCRSLAANNFYDIWNPSAGLFPLLLLAMLCWSLACGEYRLLPFTVLVASFCAQCEAGFVLPSACVLLVGLAGLAIAYVRWRGQRADARPLPRRAWSWGLAAIVIGLVCWTPTIADQIAGRGNLGLVLQAATEHRASLGPTVAGRALVRTIGWQPWWLRRVHYPFVRKDEVHRGSSTLATVTALALLGWLVLAAALALWRRRLDVLAAVAIALALCAGVWLIANATPAHPQFVAETVSYTLWSASVAGLLVWLIVVWSAIVLSGLEALIARAWRSLVRRLTPAPAIGARGLAALGAVALAALAGSSGASGDQPDEHAFEFRALGQINSRLGAVPSGRSVYLRARLDAVITPLRPEIAYDLRRRGVRALGTGAFYRTGYWYERADHRYSYDLWIYDNGRPPVPGARQVASARIHTLGRWFTVALALAPPGPLDLRKR